MKDSLLNAEKLRDIVRLENKFALEKSAHQLLLQQKETALLQQNAVIDRLWRNTLIGGIVALLLIAYFIVSRQQTNIKRKRELLIKNEEIFKTKEALDAAELENARLMEVELHGQIDLKNKELTSYTLNFIQKNELMEEVKSSIEEIKKNRRTRKPLRN